MRVVFRVQSQSNTETHNPILASRSITPKQTSVGKSKMVPPDQQKKDQQKKQEQEVSNDQDASLPLPETEMDVSPSLSTNSGDNYGNVGPQISTGQNASATAPRLAPQYSGQHSPQQVDEEDIPVSPPAPQGPPISAQVVHPSEIFSSLDEAMAAIPSPNWSCPNNDDTLPTSDGNRQQWVQKLLDAVNKIPDKPDDKSRDFKKRWDDPLTRPSNYYQPLEKLILCWRIVDLVERLHRVGPSVLHSFGDNLWAAAKRTQSWTFEHRMNEIIGLLTDSKTRCDTLLGGGSLQHIVANPEECAVATKRQADQNAKRGKILKVGREVKKQKTSAREE